MHTLTPRKPGIPSYPESPFSPFVQTKYSKLQIIANHFVPAYEELTHNFSKFASFPYVSRCSTNSLWTQKNGSFKHSMCK